MDDRQEVRLAIPAHPALLRIARYTVAALAAEKGFDYETIEDLRVAVGEACLILLGRRLGGTLTLVLNVSTECAEVEVSIDGQDAGWAGESDDEKLSAQILNSMVDQCSVDDDAGRVSFTKAVPVTVA